MVSKAPNKPVQVLALHGFTGCGEDFAEFSSLCSARFSWICPDLPGHGPKPSLNCTPDAISEFLNRQTLEHPRILLGYSMGARAALLHAIKYPDHWDALILISVNPGIEVESERAKRASDDQMLARTILDTGVPAFLKHWQRTPIIRSQQGIRQNWLTKMHKNRLKHTAEGLAASLEQFGLAAYPNLWPMLTRLKCPLLLITGEHDSKYCTFARRIGTVLPQTHWECVPNAGHMTHLEAPEQTAAAIRNFEHDIFTNKHL